jgi:hypothetical protein
MKARNPTSRTGIIILYSAIFNNGVGKRAIDPAFLIIADQAVADKGTAI